MTPVLSLITGKVGRDESFRRLVDSIVKNTDVEWELVVSDASEAPWPGTDQVRVLHEKPRLTCSRGYNNAFRAARGEFCLFLNDDAEVQPKYASTAVSFMRNHLKIGLGALHYSEDGSPYHVNSAYGCIYPNFGILSRVLGDDIGWFDEDIYMYGCDNSLAFRVLLAGYGVSDIPGACVIHHSEKDNIRTENQRQRSRDNEVLSSKYMHRKHHWQMIYNRNRVDTGTVPWSHGVDPGKKHGTVVSR
jgi:GT2 family glycosyltransferase